MSGSLLKKASSPLTLKGGPRFVDPAAKVAAGLPGPGQYSVPISVGRQPVSTKPSKPVVGFTKAQRDASKKVHPLSSTHLVQWILLCGNVHLWMHERCSIGQQYGVTPMRASSLA